MPDPANQTITRGLSATLKLIAVLGIFFLTLVAALVVLDIVPEDQLWSLARKTIVVSALAVVATAAIGLLVRTRS